MKWDNQSYIITNTQNKQNKKPNIALIVYGQSFMGGTFSTLPATTLLVWLKKNKMGGYCISPAEFCRMVNPFNSNGTSVIAILIFSSMVISIFEDIHKSHISRNLIMSLYLVYRIMFKTTHRLRNKAYLVPFHLCHYSDVILSAMASQITSLTIIY